MRERVGGAWISLRSGEDRGRALWRKPAGDFVRPKGFEDDAIEHVDEWDPQSPLARGVCLGPTRRAHEDCFPGLNNSCLIKA